MLSGGEGYLYYISTPLNDITVPSLISDNIKHYTNLKVKHTHTHNY